MPKNDACNCCETSEEHESRRNPSPAEDRLARHLAYMRKTFAGMTIAEARNGTLVEALLNTKGYLETKAV